MLIRLDDAQDLKYQPKGTKKIFKKKDTIEHGEGYEIVVGLWYAIIKQKTLDYTTVGAPDNKTKTAFIATDTATLGDKDELGELTLNE